MTLYFRIQHVFSVLFFILLIGCSSAERIKTDGVLMKVGTEIRLITDQEAKTLCKNNFCEPNYVYSIDFGKKKPIPTPTPSLSPWPTPTPSLSPKPSPSPSISPSPSPTPSVSPSPGGDTMDYSKSKLGLTEAWKTTKGSRSILVAIVDTGVEYTHEDLSQNMFINEKEKNGAAGVDDDNNGYVDDVYGFDFYNNKGNGLDDNGHGSHVAGIIGAELNGLGTVGVSPEVSILPVKFLGSDGSGTAQNAIKAIRYATAMGANVISNSWGGGGKSDLLNEAIQDAIKQGIFVIAAAGNDKSDNDKTPTYPASYSGVIAVASSDENDNLSSFSNFGKTTVFVAAPGSNIYSSYLKNTYKKLSGTSMATPQVSGALALALSLKKNLTQAQMLDVMCNNAEKILLQSAKCGRLNVAKLIKELAQ
ncbi:MAG: S8 family serine peptidase [Deltaproteobacteria bacterium]|nr:S8 family serine peptidase [Deltaproteobacteria bacterium]